MRFRFWKKPKAAGQQKKAGEKPGQERPLVTEKEKRQQAEKTGEDARVQQAKKTRERKEQAQKEVIERAKMIKAGSKLPDFSKACAAKGIDPGQAFQNLYRHFSRLRGLSELEAMAEVGSRIEGRKFSEARFWAEIMVLNGLQPVSKAKVPKKYLEFVKSKKKK